MVNARSSNPGSRTSIVRAWSSATLALPRRSRSCPGAAMPTSSSSRNGSARTPAGSSTSPAIPSEYSRFATRSATQALDPIATSTSTPGWRSAKHCRIDGRT